MVAGMTISEYLERLDNIDEPEITPEIQVIIDGYTTWSLTWDELKKLVSTFSNHNIVIRSVS